jgi:hypothetical protein
MTDLLGCVGKAVPVAVPRSLFRRHYSALEMAMPEFSAAEFEIE